MTEQRLLKAEEVAVIMGIPKARVYLLSRTGEMGGILVRVGRRQFRYRQDALIDYIARGGHGCSEEGPSTSRADESALKIEASPRDLTGSHSQLAKPLLNVGVPAAAGV